jgi:CubicO group peptidase (beta-lactamase class C family)
MGCGNRADGGRLHAAAERHLGEEKVPGLAALVARDGQVHAEALGRLAARGPPVARDSIFRIASTTKPIPRRRRSPCPPRG